MYEIEIYDKNNPEHNDTNLYEVVEWSNIIDSDNRHPNSVQIGTIEDDMARRDFSINAMYWNFDGIIATKQSINDIQNKVLRFIGKPEDRIAEDALRGWRAFRLAKTKDLQIEKNTLVSLRRNWDTIFKNSNPQRVLLEIEKM